MTRGVGSRRREKTHRENGFAWNHPTREERRGENNTKRNARCDDNSKKSMASVSCENTVASERVHEKL